MSYIDALREKYPFGVSTDSVGILGDPKRVGEFWLPLLPPGTMIGLEYLMLRWLSARDTDLPIIGLHGRMHEHDGAGSLLPDPIDRVRTYAVNHILVDTSKLLAIAAALGKDQELPPYALIHELAAQTNKFEQPVSGVVLAIENHARPGSVTRTKAKVEQLQSLGQAAISVFDLVHFFKPLGGDNRKYWGQMLTTLQDLGQSLIHLSVGDEDCLQLDRIDAEMWRDLGSVIQGMQGFVILEHQGAGPRKYRADLTKEPAYQDKAKQVLSTLAKGGVLNI